MNLFCRPIRRTFFVALFFCFAWSKVDAQTTLQKIKTSNTIVLGYRDTSVPFSYLVGTSPVGYSNDIALKLVEAIKKKINAPGLVVRQIPITSQNRVPLVANGTLDMECGSTTNSVERQRQVAFSNSIFVYSVRFITRKDSGITSFEQLRGKTVAVTAGGTVERLARERNEQGNMDIRVVSSKDHSESFMLTETGRAAAFVMDEPLLYGARMTARRPSDWIVTGEALQSENYACMFRKGDPEFKSLTDDVIAQMQKSGEMKALFVKWFESPIPPKGLNMEYPFTPQLADLFEHPNDRPLK